MLIISAYSLTQWPDFTTTRSGNARSVYVTINFGLVRGANMAVVFNRRRVKHVYFRPIWPFMGKGYILQVAVPRGLRNSWVVMAVGGF